MKNKEKRILIISIIASLAVGGLFSAYVIPRINKTVSGWGNNELLTLITIIGVLVALSVPFIEYLLKKITRKSVYQIDILIDTSLTDNMVRFSASIHNVGDKQIVTKTSQIYIDQGFETDLKNDRDDKTIGKWFDFPFILEHKNFIDGRPDCVLCEKCFRRSEDIYPEESVLPAFRAHDELIRSHLPLKHLSNLSIKYINPKEKFSEDVIIQFPNQGVYRVTLFVGMEGEADCQCATKQFYISESLIEKTGGSPE